MKQHNPNIKTTKRMREQGGRERDRGNGRRQKGRRHSYNYNLGV